MLLVCLKPKSSKMFAIRLSLPAYDYISQPTSKLSSEIRKPLPPTRTTPGVNALRQSSSGLEPVTAVPRVVSTPRAKLECPLQV